MVPAAAVNVTFTPVDQLPVVSVTVPGLERDRGAAAARQRHDHVARWAPPTTGRSKCRSRRPRCSAWPDSRRWIAGVEGAAEHGERNDRRARPTAAARRCRRPSPAPCDCRARVRTAEAYGAAVSVLTSAPSTRNSTRPRRRCRWPWPRNVTSRPDCDLLPARRAGEADRWAACWRGGVLPPLQAVPFSVNAVGALFVPLNVPLKPAVKLPPLPMLLFQSALLATVIWRAARRLRERNGPAILQALPVRETEDQRPAIGDGRSVVGDDDVGAEAVAAFPALGVRRPGRKGSAPSDAGCKAQATSGSRPREAKSGSSLQILMNISP